jgi:predicted porin
VFSRGWLNEGNIFNTVVNPTTAPTFDSTFNLTSLRFADNDSDKINYYTPRFAGFQLGASYIPDSSQDTAAPRSASAAYTRGWAVGANFVRTFGDFDVAVAGGYMQWQGPQTAAAASAPDPDAYSAGIQLGYAGFRVGASYARIKDGRQGAAGGSGAGTASVSTAGTGTGIIDGDAWDVGASYTFGPASVSLTYFEGSNDAGACSTATQTCTTIGEDELTGLALAGKYILGPGVSWDSVLFYAEVEGFSAAGSAVSNEAAGVVTGFTLAF